MGCALPVNGAHCPGGSMEEAEGSIAGSKLCRKGVGGSVPSTAGQPTVIRAPRRRVEH